MNRTKTYAFQKAASLSELQFNETECVFNVTSIEFLGHIFDRETFRSDPARYKPLMDQPEPNNLKQLNHIIYLYAYYAK